MNKNILNKNVVLVNFNKKTPTIFNVVTLMHRIKEL